MYIIAGLGNPGSKYAGSRHNVGFMTLDALADRYQIEIREKAHKALIGKGVIEGQKVILVKPQTYMNLSGESIRSVMDYYKVEPSEFIVIYDDISLDPGSIRIRKKGSAGGHNGIKNIITHLGTQEFLRIRIGVGAKPPWMDLADYVLERFSKEELPAMQQSFQDGAAAVVSMMNEGVDAAMNHFNGAARGENKERQAKVKEERAARRRAAKRQGDAEAETLKLPETKQDGTAEEAAERKQQLLGTAEEAAERKQQPLGTAEEAAERKQQLEAAGNNAETKQEMAPETESSRKKEKGKTWLGFLRTPWKN